MKKRIPIFSALVFLYGVLDVYQHLSLSLRGFSSMLRFGQFNPLIFRSLFSGLIPGAISNPGSYSLDAALDPTETEYYYYALDPSTGSHHFSKTLKEHNDFLESIRKEEPEEETEE